MQSPQAQHPIVVQQYLQGPVVQHQVSSQRRFFLFGCILFRVFLAAAIRFVSCLQHIQMLGFGDQPVVQLSPQPVNINSPQQMVLQGASGTTTFKLVGQNAAGQVKTETTRVAVGEHRKRLSSCVVVYIDKRGIFFASADRAGGDAHRTARRAADPASPVPRPEPGARPAVPHPGLGHAAARAPGTGSPRAAAPHRGSVPAVGDGGPGGKSGSHSAAPPGTCAAEPGTESGARSANQPGDGGVQRWGAGDCRADAWSSGQCSDFFSHQPCTLSSC